MMLGKARKAQPTHTLGPLLERVLHVRAKDAEKRVGRARHATRSAKPGRGRAGKAS